MSVAVVLAAAFMAGGVGDQSPSVPTVSEPTEMIVYQTYPSGLCFRMCPSLTITALSNGRVWIENRRGRRLTRRFVQISAERYALFRERLRAFRPNGNSALVDEPECREFLPDMDGVVVSWQNDGRNDRLTYDFGCDEEERADMARALIEAPSMLNIPNLQAPRVLVATSRRGN